jgi:hypothetical protein
MTTTIRRIGDAIHQGSHHLPTRNLAASLATTAPRKNYREQARAIFNGFVQRWRYVHDPLTRELLTEGPDASFRWVMAGDGRGLGYGLGAGDCDCATIALGSLFEAVGLPVRLATTAFPGKPPGRLMNHIYPEVFVKNGGWIPADPVGYPEKKFGQESKYSRKAIYDLSGNLVKTFGNFAGETIMKPVKIIPDTWSRAPLQTFGTVPEEWSRVGLKNFGCRASKMGVLNGLGQMIEVGAEDKNPYGGNVRTPIVELSPADFAFLAQTLIPYTGMSGVADNGQVVVYDGLSGFWRKLSKGLAATASAGASLAVENAKKKAKQKSKTEKPTEKTTHETLKKLFALSEKLKNTKGGAKILKGVGLKSKSKEITSQSKIIADNLDTITSPVGAGRVAVNISGDVRVVEMRIVRPLLSRIGEIAPVSAFVPGPGTALNAMQSAKKQARQKTKMGVRKTRG